MTNQRQDKHTPRWTEDLEDLEKEAGVPMVPGELRSWCRPVKERLYALREAWEVRDNEEKARLEEILNADLALAPRVEALTEKRRALGESLRRFQKEIEALLAREAQDPQGSWEPTEAVNDVREALLSWIVRSRAYDSEVETWMIEALARDRGTVD